MFLDAILERNKRFTAGREAKPLPAVDTISLAVVACYDPRLDALIGPALGLDPGSAFVYRAAGAVVPPSGDPLRSLAMAVFLFGAKQIAVVGHTSCRMAQFSTAAFIDSFRARGVTREAFGSEDLRVWSGAISDPRSGVRASVATILAAPFMPKDLEVAGLVLDDTTGALEVVHRPGDMIAAGVGPTAGGPVLAAEPPGDGAPAAAPAPPPPPPRAAAGAGYATAPPARAPGAAPSSRPFPDAPPPGPHDARSQDLLRALQELQGFIRGLEESPFWRHELSKLRQEMDRQTNVVGRMAVLENFVHKAGAESRQVVAAFDRLKRETASARAGFGLEDVVDLFWRSALKR